MDAFLWAVFHSHQAVLEREVVIRRTDVNVAEIKSLRVDGDLNRQSRLIAHDLRQQVHQGPVHHHEYCRGQVTGKRSKELTQGLDGSGGSSNHNDVPNSHRLPLFPTIDPSASLRPLSSLRATT